jgi:hypothetical protein
MQKITPFLWFAEQAEQAAKMLKLDVAERERAARGE